MQNSNLRRIKCIKINHLVFLGIIIYTLIAIVVSVERYWQFSSFYLDLGLYDQAIWRLSRFQPPIIDHIRDVTSGKIIFADHFNPSILLFAPVYWFTPRSEILLIIQAIFVGLSAIILYKTSQLITNNYLIKFTLITSFLGYIGLQNALITDFHDATLVTLPLALFFWSMYKKKWKLFWVCIIVILGFKESMTGLGMGLGIYVLLTGDKKRGVFIFLLSTVWAILTTKFIIPYFSSGDFFYMPELPNSVLSGVQSLFYPWIKTKTIIYSFATFGFLPIAYIPLLPAILENFIERFVFNNITTRWDLGFHYNAPLAPLLFMASLQFIKKYSVNKKFFKLINIWCIFTILTVLTLHRFILHGPLSLAFQPAFYETTKANKFLEVFVLKIPTDGLIMTQQNIATRFTHNCVITLKKNYKNFNPDYIALDLRQGQNIANFYPLSEEGTRELFNILKTDNNYKLTTLTDSTFIFAKTDKKRDNNSNYCYMFK